MRHSHAERSCTEANFLSIDVASLGKRQKPQCHHTDQNPGRSILAADLRTSVPTGYPVSFQNHLVAQVPVVIISIGEIVIVAR